METTTTPNEQQEQHEREVTTFFSLLNSAAWVLDDLIGSKDPNQHIKDNEGPIDQLLNTIQEWLGDRSDDYVAALRKFGGKDAYVALWMKGRGMAIDVTYYCSKCVHEERCAREGKRIKGPDSNIDDCFERKTSILDN